MVGIHEAWLMNIFDLINRFEHADNPRPHHTIPILLLR